MANRFVTQRLACLAVVLFALSLVGVARAQEAQDQPQPSQQATPVPGQTPAGQKGGGRRGGGGGGDAASATTTPAASEQHRLPPDATTKQTLALPGRTLNFTATAGSIRLYDDKGEPQADIAYTS
jgi:hypothetical protein